MNNKNKIILDLCGGTGSWSRPYKEAGYKVINVTLPDYDVRTYKPPKNVYGILAAPPCNQFSVMRCNTAKEKRNLAAGMEIVKSCLNIIWNYQYLNTPLKFWALENPATGMLKRFLGYPPYTWQPFDFGDRASKKTGLWGKYNFPVKNPIPLTKSEKEYQRKNHIHKFPFAREYPGLGRPADGQSHQEVLQKHFLKQINKDASSLKLHASTEYEEEKKNYYARTNIYRVMSWKDNDEYKFERLEYYFKKYLNLTNPE